MGFMGKATKLVKGLAGIRIYRSAPPGTDFFRDVARSLPLFSADVVFDVGANLGQSAREYVSKFPKARIYSFEPASETFHSLRDNVKDFSRVECFCMALGSTEEAGELVLEGTSNMFFVRAQSREKPVDSGVATEPIVITMLDQFCASKGIPHIDFLKVDTEGADLEVLKGATKMLAAQKIDLVQVEAGMNSGNTRHVPFETLKAFLESHGYVVFRLYEQMSEWPTKEPHLRRVNAVFVSRDMVVKHRMPMAMDTPSLA